MIVGKWVEMQTVLFKLIQMTFQVVFQLSLTMFIHENSNSDSIQVKESLLFISVYWFEFTSLPSIRQMRVSKRVAVDLLHCTTKRKMPRHMLHGMSIIWNMIIVIQTVLFQKYDILLWEMHWIQVEDQSSSQCVVRSERSSIYTPCYFVFRVGCGFTSSLGSQCW